jgi:hypothetical protein
MTGRYGAGQIATCRPILEFTLWAWILVFTIPALFAGKNSKRVLVAQSWQALDDFEKRSAQYHDGRQLKFLLQTGAPAASTFA